MSKGIAVELESYRLAQYAIQVPCYICGEGNLFDAELCRFCFAPMALAHQAATQKTAPYMLATLGASGVGKTVYLGMLLDMLARQPERLQIMARGRLFDHAAAVDGLGHGPLRVSQQDAQRARPLELDALPGAAAEAKAAGRVDHARPGRRGAVRGARSSAHLPRGSAAARQAAGVLVLVDAFRLQDGAPDQDYFTLKLLSYFSELDDNPKTGWRNRPLAIIFSKADEADECFDDPELFAQRHAPRLWEHCRRLFRGYRFFAAGLAGVCAERNVRGEIKRVPLRVEPRGIIEPFEWLLSQIKA